MDSGLVSLASMCVLGIIIFILVWIERTARQTPGIYEWPDVYSRCGSRSRAVHQKPRILITVSLFHLPKFRRLTNVPFSVYKAPMAHLAGYRWKSNISGRISFVSGNLTTIKFPERTTPRASLSLIISTCLRPCTTNVQGLCLCLRVVRIRDQSPIAHMLARRILGDQVSLMFAVIVFRTWVATWKCAPPASGCCKIVVAEGLFKFGDVGLRASAFSGRDVITLRLVGKLRASRSEAYKTWRLTSSGIGDLLRVLTFT